MTARGPVARPVAGVFAHAAAGSVALVLIPLVLADGASPSWGSVPSSDEAAGDGFAHSGSPRTWASLGVLAGPTQMDSRLADYQWDTALQGSWGVQALAGHGRWALGARFWSTQNTQQLDVSGVSAAPVVRSTSLSLLARGALASVLGSQLFVNVSAGRMHMGYHPDQVSIPTGGTPIVVDLAPLDQWIAGGGLGMERIVARRWAVSFEADDEVFALDTAHRNGATIQNTRTSFGEWTARFELARRFDWR